MSLNINFIHFEQERKKLPKRAYDAHKGDFGHVCIVGAGHSGYAGAVCLAGAAALRSGAGLVSALVHPQALVRMGAAPKELMCYGLECQKDLNNLNNLELIENVLKKATVIVLGPGLTQSDWARVIFNKILTESKVPVVIDADGLNLLAQAPMKKNNWILTPHPGEAARLLNMTVEALQNDRAGAVQDLQAKWGGVVILKGAGTLVCTEQAEILQCQAGNPGMATGGMGDLLAGLLGGLLAQGLDLASAAKLGVMVHALAADRQKVKGERGMLASDLLEEFRVLLN